MKFALLFLYPIICIGIANVKSDHHKVNNETKHVHVEKSDMEVESKAGYEAVFKCNIDLAMNTSRRSVEWFKDDESIESIGSERFKFSRSSNEEPIRQTFTIEDVKYTDRGKYMCSITLDDNVYSKKFMLRVRDPLGALWPFIGILVEAIILAVIIGSFEHFKKKGVEKDENSFVNDKEPLIGQNSNVTFNSSKGEVETTTG